MSGISQGVYRHQSVGPSSPDHFSRYYFGSSPASRAGSVEPSEVGGGCSPAQRSSNGSERTRAPRSPNWSFHEKTILLQQVIIFMPQVTNREDHWRSICQSLQSHCGRHWEVSQAKQQLRDLKKKYSRVQNSNGRARSQSEVPANTTFEFHDLLATILEKERAIEASGGVHAEYMPVPMENQVSEDSGRMALLRSTPSLAGSVFTPPSHRGPKRFSLSQPYPPRCGPYPLGRHRSGSASPILLRSTGRRAAGITSAASVGPTMLNPITSAPVAATPTPRPGPHNEVRIPPICAERAEVQGGPLPAIRTASPGPRLPDSVNLEATIGELKAQVESMVAFQQESARIHQEQFRRAEEVTVQLIESIQKLAHAARR
ncbi:hypothetical protein H4R33_005738 [Dimargaris cristalligena]|nr:hypothetical protein H4R33_005738 [Dimargaris cristalligena]